MALDISSGCGVCSGDSWVDDDEATAPQPPDPSPISAAASAALSIFTSLGLFFGLSFGASLGGGAGGCGDLGGTGGGGVSVLRFPATGSGSWGLVLELGAGSIGAVSGSKGKGLALLTCVHCSMSASAGRATPRRFRRCHHHLPSPMAMLPVLTSAREVQPTALMLLSATDGSLTHTNLITAKEEFTGQTSTLITLHLQRCEQADCATAHSDRNPRFTRATRQR